MTRAATFLALCLLAFSLGGVARATIGDRIIPRKPVVEYSMAVAIGDSVRRYRSDEKLCRQTAADLTFGQDFVADIDGKEVPAKFLYCLILIDGVIVDYVRPAPRPLRLKRPLATDRTDHA